MANGWVGWWAGWSSLLWASTRLHWHKPSSIHHPQLVNDHFRHHGVPQLPLAGVQDRSPRQWQWWWFMVVRLGGWYAMGDGQWVMAGADWWAMGGAWWAMDGG